MSSSQLTEKEGAQILLDIFKHIPKDARPKKRRTKKKRKTKPLMTNGDFRRWNPPRHTKQRSTKPWRTKSTNLAQIKKIVGKGLDQQGREYVLVQWKGYKMPSFTLRDHLNSQALKWLQTHEHELSDYLVSDGE